MTPPRMRPIAGFDRERLQEHHQGAMPDRCAIGTVTAAPIPCRRADIPPEQITLTGGATAGVMFHLPVDTVIADTASIWLVRRHGEPVIPPEEYLQTSEPVRGVLAVTVNARLREGAG